MAEEREIIVKVRADSAKAIVGITNAKNAIKELQAEYDSLSKAAEENGGATRLQQDTMEQLQQRMKEQKQVVSTLTKEVQNNYKVMREEEGSLVALRAELSNLTKQYDALSRAEREGAAGQELQNKINAITTEIKGSEEATQRYYRNVGNYAMKVVPMLEQQVPALSAARAGWSAMSDIAKASADEMKNITATFIQSTKSMQGMTVAQKAATVATSGLTAGMKILKVALISTGIGAIVVALGSLVAYFQKTQQGVEMASKAMAGLGAVVDVIIDRAGKLGKAFVQLMSGDFKGAAESAKGAFQGVGEEIKNETKQAVALKDAANQLEKQEASLEAKRAAQKVTLAELKRTADDTTKSYEERMRAAQQATAIEMETAAEINRLGEQKIANQLGYLEVTDEVRGVIEQLKNGADADAIISNLGLAESTIKDYQGLVGTFKEYQQGVQEFSQMAVEGTTKQNGIRKEAVEKRKAMLDKELNEVAAAIDAEIELLAEGLDKERAKEQAAYDRDIADLKNRLATETDLTLTAKEALNRQIEAREKEHQQTMAALDKEALMQRLNEEATTIQMRLDLAIAGSEEELHWKQEKLAQEFEIAMQNDNLTAEQRMLLQEKYWQDSLALDAEYAEKVAEETEKKAEAEKKAAEETTAKAKAESEAKVAAVAQTLGAMSGLLSEFGAKNKAAAIAAKALALGEIAVSQGKAIAAGVAEAAATGPFPANLAAIATTVTTIISTILTAIKTVKGAKFATGGYVSGEGTATSDSIPAMLSNGESVNTAAATSLFSPIYSALNQMGGGSPIVPTTMSAGTGIEAGEDMLARAVAKGVSQLNITVGVDEITRVQNRVKYIEALSQF